MCSARTVISSAATVNIVAIDAANVFRHAALLPRQATANDNAAAPTTAAEIAHPYGVNPKAAPSRPKNANATARMVSERLGPADQGSKRPTVSRHQTADQLASTYVTSSLAAAGRCVHHSPRSAMTMLNANHGAIVSSVRETRERGGLSQRRRVLRARLRYAISATMAAATTVKERDVDCAPVRTRMYTAARTARFTITNAPLSNWSDRNNPPELESRTSYDHNDHTRKYGSAGGLHMSHPRSRLLLIATLALLLSGSPALAQRQPPRTNSAAAGDIAAIAAAWRLLADGNVAQASRA